MTKYIKDTMRRIAKYLNSNKARFIESHLKEGNLDHIAKEYILQQDSFLTFLADKQKSRVYPPLYLYRRKIFSNQIHQFRKIFKKYIPNLEVYYPIKINHYSGLIKDAVTNGLGLEVASVRELRIAINAGSKQVIYYSPGKRESDLQEIIKNAHITRIHIDSFGELVRLGTLTNTLKRSIKAGVRINLPLHGDWNKYGISLIQLYDFWGLCYKKYPYIQLEGIHFHTSRNKSPHVYVETLKQLSQHITKNFSSTMKKNIRYLDFGGGFDTRNTEGVFSKNTNLGVLINALKLFSGGSINNKNSLYIQESSTLHDFAHNIAKGIKKYITPVLGEIKYITEPGRILADGAMDLLVQIEDVKSPNLAITGGGGVHMVGWQRFMFEYFPKINITHPSYKEILFRLSGSLCTTYDTWGDTCYAEKCEVGDYIVIPNQGTLTYTLAHSFINEIPSVETVDF